MIKDDNRLYEDYVAPAAESVELTMNHSIADQSQPIIETPPGQGEPGE